MGNWKFSLAVCVVESDFPPTPQKSGRNLPKKQKKWGKIRKFRHKGGAPSGGVTHTPCGPCAGKQISNVISFAAAGAAF